MSMVIGDRLCRFSCTRASLVLAIVLATTRVAFGHGDAVCAPERNQAEIAAARATVDRSPDALGPRLALSELLVQESCYDEAMHTLETAQARHPGDAQVENRLRLIRSFVAERQFFDGLDAAQAEARLSRNVLRCSRLDDLAACDEATRLKPDSAEIIGTKAAALAKRGRIADALTTYRRAAALANGNTEIDARLREADTQRRELSKRCLAPANADALPLCEAALLAGETDEFDVRRRIAELHQGANRLTEALDAYIGARMLRPGDIGTAKAIVTLVDSTGRRDAAALAVRGTSLLTVGRTRDALSSLQEAQLLAPGLPDLAAAISAAEQQLRIEERVAITTRTAAAPPPAATPAVVAPSPSPAQARVFSNSGSATRSH